MTQSVTDPKATTQKTDAERRGEEAGRAANAGANQAAGAAGQGAVDAAKAAADAARKGGDIMRGAAEDPAAAAKKAAEKAKETGKGFFDNLDIGSLVGGALGIFGAWFLGGMFGEGSILSTILTIGMAIPLMMIGSRWGGETVNGWLGRDKKIPGQEQAKGREPAVGQDRAQAQGAGQGREAVGKPPAASRVFTEAEMHAMLATAKTRGLPDDKVVLQRTADGLVPTPYDPKIASAETRTPPIPVESFQRLFDECKADRKPAAITLTDMTANTDVQVGCLPKGTVLPAPGAAR
jgi:hypothetical protein